jgi:hypothetical protein
MTDYEQKLLSQLQSSFDSGECHVCFDIPEFPEESEKLLSALHSLKDASKIIILASPETGYDYIEVEMCPPCCKSLVTEKYDP